MRENFQEEYFVGRFAGDEYMVVLPDCRAETAFVLAEEVRRLVSENEMELAADGETVRYPVTLKAGVAAYPGDAREGTELIRKSEEGLFRAGRQGGNRVCLPDDKQMITKTSYYTQTQLERLSALSKALRKTEAFLLREALDDVLIKYDTSRLKPQK